MNFVGGCPLRGEEHPNADEEQYHEDNAAEQGRINDLIQPEAN